jgi:hypothetical protein
MAEIKTLTGGCHCGKVRYEVKADISAVTACNCSICSRAGWLLAAVPGEQFTLLSGADDLSDYQFAKNRIHHLFCRSCGIRSFSRGATPDGKEMYAVNVRCLDDLDIESLPVTRFDGKSI